MTNSVRTEEWTDVVWCWCGVCLREVGQLMFKAFAKRAARSSSQTGLGLQLRLVVTVKTDNLLHLTSSKLYRFLLLGRYLSCTYRS